MIALFLSAQGACVLRSCLHPNSTHTIRWDRGHEVAGWGGQVETQDGHTAQPEEACQPFMSIQAAPLSPFLLSRAVRHRPSSMSFGPALLCFRVTACLQPPPIPSCPPLPVFTFALCCACCRRSAMPCRWCRMSLCPASPAVPSSTHTPALTTTQRYGCAPCALRAATSHHTTKASRSRTCLQSCTHRWGCCLRIGL